MVAERGQIIRQGYFKQGMCLASPKNIDLTSPRKWSVRIWGGEQTIPQLLRCALTNSVPRGRGVRGGGRPRAFERELEAHRGDTEKAQ